MDTPEPEITELAVRPGLAPVRRGSFDPDLSRAMYQEAVIYSKSEMVPKHFQGKPADCFIMVQLADRFGMDVFSLMQASYVVHGRPGFEGKLVAALMNSSPLIIGRVQYEENGAKGDDYGVRAWATDSATGKPVYGPWITWRLVKAEGWDDKPGSKWKTMPDQMFHYRAVSWFGKRHYPDRLMGIVTVEELVDAGPVEVRTTEDRAASLRERLAPAPPAPDLEPTPPVVEREILDPEKPPFGAGETVAEHDDARLEALFNLHTGLVDLGASEADQDTLVWVKTGKTAMSQLTRAEAVSLFQGLGEYGDRPGEKAGGGLGRFKAMLRAEKGKKNREQGGLFKK